MYHVSVLLILMVKDICYIIIMYYVNMTLDYLFEAVALILYTKSAWLR